MFNTTLHLQGKDLADCTEEYPKTAIVLDYNPKTKEMFISMPVKTEPFMFRFVPFEMQVRKLYTAWGSPKNWVQRKIHIWPIQKQYLKGKFPVIQFKPIGD